MDLGVKRNKKPSIYASDKCVLYTFSEPVPAVRQSQRNYNSPIGIHHCRVCFFATFFIQYSIPVLEIMMLNFPRFEKP